MVLLAAMMSTELFSFFLRFESDSSPSASSPNVLLPCVPPPSPSSSLAEIDEGSGVPVDSTWLEICPRIVDDGSSILTVTLKPSVRSPPS
eukprot:Gb_32034 [translate_table: standard]